MHRNIARGSPVLDQQQVDSQQLGVQHRGEREHEELGIHRPSASIGYRHGREAVPARVVQAEVGFVSGHASPDRVWPTDSLQLGCYLAVVAGGIITAVTADDLERVGVAAFRPAVHDAGRLATENGRPAIAGLVMCHHPRLLP
jgi:hypothetical protein